VKKIVIFVLYLSIVSSIPVLAFRWRLEADNRYVEMACDYSQLSQLSRQWKYELEQFLCELKEAGIDSIAIEEETLEKLSQEGKLILVQGEELEKFHNIVPVQPIFLKNLMMKDLHKYAFVITDDLLILDKIEKILAEKLGGKRVMELGKASYGKNKAVLGLYGMGETDISQVGIGFSKEKIEAIANCGLKSILLLANGPLINESSLKTLLSSVEDWGNVSGVIFSGDTVPGYPDFLDSLRRELETREIKLGIVEFLNQDGLAKVTENISERIVRVHSISAEDIVSLDPGDGLKVSRLISRFSRATRERNVRLLHIFLPFISGNSENPQVQSNIEYIRKIRASISGNNFMIGLSKPFQTFPPSLYLFTFPIFLLFLMAPLWLLSFYRSFSSGFYYSYLFSSLVLIILFSEKQLFVQIVALIAALSFPILALALGLLLYRSPIAKAKSQENPCLVIWSFLKVTGVTIVGGLLIASLLSRLEFMLGIYQFRGVKVSLILPLIMGLFFVAGWSERFRKKSDLSNFYMTKISEFLKRKVEFRHLLTFLTLVLAVTILVLRSGNYPGPFLWDMENRARELLEKLVIVRPRIKEFLLGHPLMIVGIYLYLKNRSEIGEKPSSGKESWQLFIILGMIGQVSVINSFCHAHSPLVISVLRTVNGIWLGMATGTLLLIALRLWKKTYRDL